MHAKVEVTHTGKRRKLKDELRAPVAALYIPGYVGRSRNESAAAQRKIWRRGRRHTCGCDKGVLDLNHLDGLVARCPSEAGQLGSILICPAVTWIVQWVSKGF